MGGGGDRDRTEGQRVLFTLPTIAFDTSRRTTIRFIGATTDLTIAQDATADHIASAVQAVKDSGAVALFAENSNSKSIEAIARGAA